MNASKGQKSKHTAEYDGAKLDQLLNTICSSSEWVETQGFQDSIVQNARHRLRHRLKGFLMHKRQWEDNQTTDKDFERTFKKFEDEHFRSYKRWLETTNLPNEGFSLKKNPKAEGDKRFDMRIRRLFVYYLVYGELHDFRGTKNVLNLFYHVTIQKLFNQESMVAEWIRRQGRSLYELLSLVYSNEEMNQNCFHHDDLDDLCGAKGFIEKRFYPDCDFAKAFDVHDIQDGPFKNLAKVMKLSTPLFIKYWSKQSQDSLNDIEQHERDKWVRKEFLRENDPELVRLEKEMTEIDQKINLAQQEYEYSLDKYNSSDRYKPDEREIQDTTVRQVFRRGYTQSEIAKPFMTAAESNMNEAKDLFRSARVKYWRNNDAAKKHFELAISKAKQAEGEFMEARKGYGNALTDFSSIPECDSYTRQASLQLAKSNLWIQRSKQLQITIKLSMLFQLRYIEAVHKDREHFAKRWKTYVERAGGYFGISGYLTILRNYSTVVYLHLFLLLPLTWLYFDYHNLIGIDTFVDDVRSLVSLDTLFSIERNLLLPIGGTLALMILFGILNFIWLRNRVKGGAPYSIARKDKNAKFLWNFKGWLINLSLWICVIISELLILKFLVFSGVYGLTANLINNFSPIKTPLLLIISWVPVISLYLATIQFVFTLWVGFFGWVFGKMDSVTAIKTWGDVVDSFEPPTLSRSKLPYVVQKFRDTMLPSHTEITLPRDPLDLETGKTKLFSPYDMRDYIAFAKVWNETISYFYEIHKLSKEETQRYSFSIKGEKGGDYLSGEIENVPDLLKEPKSKEVKYHIIRFVNNICNPNKPRKHISIKEMKPLTVVTPVGNEKILYQYEYITHVDNTQHSFLGHLIQLVPDEWDNFKRKECLHPKSIDYISRLEKDILQGVQPDQNPKRWIHSHRDGIALKMKLSEWASIRFQALFRTINGFMQIPKALVVLARIEDPLLSQSDAELLIREKFSFVVGLQCYGNHLKVYQNSKSKADSGETLSKEEANAHDAVFNVNHIIDKFPDHLRIAYPAYEGGKHLGKLITGTSKNGKPSHIHQSVELFGPIGDLGLGKPTNHCFLTPFIDGLVVQTIDVNQDSAISQSFMIPSVLAEFDKDKSVKIVGCPEFITTTNWSTTAWCSAFSERTFGTLVQRVYSRMGIRLHYGHPDFLDGLWVMAETGLSKMAYVSEDIFTGMDTVLKGGKITHIEYHEVGKARDVDLYTTTKFMRKISMGAAQMACTRWVNQLQSSKNVGHLQRLSIYYSTIGFYFNHLMLYISIWFALISQLCIVIVQKYIYEEQVTNFMSRSILSFQIGFALVAPGVLQLILEHGLFGGLWEYAKKFFILAIYSTFHIKNFSSYWQRGLTRNAFYLPSGRGSGLEHYFMRDLFSTFYYSHWRAGFAILWIGLLTLILSGDWLVFFIMYLLPASIWLWGASFLNPGALPTNVHEEQWKRLTNRDMSETRQIIRDYSEVHNYQRTLGGSFLSRSYRRLARGISNGIKRVHWLYVYLNFNLHMRVVRLIAIIAMGYEYILAPKIPTLIFTDERRRILRWEEEENRYRSAFFGSINQKDDDASPPSQPQQDQDKANVDINENSVQHEHDNEMTQRKIKNDNKNTNVNNNNNNKSQRKLKFFSSTKKE